MTTPVTGPHSVVKASGLYQEDNITYWKQKRPYDIALPMVHNRYFWSPGSPVQAGSLDGDVKVAGHVLGLSEVAILGYQEAYAKAYSRFIGDLGDNASLGVTLVQYNQAKGMIAKRANTLVSFAGALARRSPLGIARSLSISVEEAQRVLKTKRVFGPKRQTKYATARPLADLWLEFWFGWKPAVSDIYTACEVLNDPLPVARVKGTGKVVREETFGGEFPATKITKRKYVIRAGLGADVGIKNPQLRLLQQLGLLNPYVVAFDAIPWSFTLGWFSNINSWLSSFTDFAGLDIQRAFTTRKTDCTVNTSWRDCVGLPGCSESEQAVYRSWTGDGWCYEKERKILATNEIPYPALIWQFKEIKPARALTAISLLVQKLPR